MVLATYMQPVEPSTIVRGPAALTMSFICGLGGREVTLEDVNKAVDMCDAAARSGKSDAKTHWLGVRE